MMTLALPFSISLRVFSNTENLVAECRFERFKVAFPMLARDNADFLECKRDEMFAKFKEKTFVRFACFGRLLLHAYFRPSF